MMWVKLTLPPRLRARWLLMTMRLSTSSLAGTARTEVAVGTSSEDSMFVTTRAPAPRMGCERDSSSGPVCFGACGSRGIGAGGLGLLLASPSGSGSSAFFASGSSAFVASAVGGLASARLPARPASGSACSARLLRLGLRRLGLLLGRRARRSVPLASGGRGGAVGGRRAGPRRGRSPRRSSTTPCRRCSCPVGTARTARRPATRWVRMRSGGRWTGTARPRAMRLFHRLVWGRRGG